MTGRAVLVVVVALALSACTPLDQGASEDERSSDDAFALFLSCMRQVTYDYEPAETPAALAAEADAVVTGTIVDLRPGQSYAPGPGHEPDFATAVLEVRVDELLVGEDAVVTDGSVYLEMPRPRRGDCDRAPTAYGVFFLVDLTNEPYSNVILREEAGRPPGARLTAPLVQGFLIEDPAGKLVSVQTSLDLMPKAWRSLDSADEVVKQLDRAG